MLLNQVPTRLAVAAVNATSVAEPRVILGGEPYGASLRGLPIYTNWYNRPLFLELSNALDGAAVTAILDAQNPDFIIVPTLSADPIDRKLVDYAQQRGTRVPLSGNIGLWRIIRPR